MRSAGALLRPGGLAAIVLAACVGLARPAAAQDPCPCPPQPPAPPPPVWTGSIGAGLALTQGNTDTTNTNVSFDVVRDPKTKVVFKAQGLYIRATQDGNDNVDRALVSGRVEYKLTPRAYTFGQLQYVRDRFKEIDYLLAPTAGLGYLLVDDGRLTVDVDSALGVVTEKNTGLDARTSGALTSGQRLAFKISDTATLTQNATALWKLDDFGDGLYTFGIGVAAAVTSRIQVKLEFQDVYKARPSAPGVQSNDLAFLTTLVYKF
jgi:putative salt-induced outer membrane protein YdiY